MRKRKDFTIQQANISTESNQDSRYMILKQPSKRKRMALSEKETVKEVSITKRRGRRRNVNSEDVFEGAIVKQENTIVNNVESVSPHIPSQEHVSFEENHKKRGRPKKIKVSNNNMAESERENAPCGVKDVVAIQDVDKLKNTSNNHVREASSIKEETIIELLGRKIQEITDLFSEVKNYFTGLTKTISEKSSRIDDLERVVKTQTALLCEYKEKVSFSKQSVANSKEPPKKVNLKKTRKKKSVPQIKNMTINENDGSKDFNFGVRKPVTNCEELLSNNAWEKYLIGKWVHEYIPSEGRDVFYKHVLQNSRVLQIVYSGLDILGDGVYVLYKARLYEKGEDFFVSPQEFNLLFGSFECEDYLGELLARDLITEEEMETLKVSKNRETFKLNLPVMKESLAPKKNVE